MSYMYMTTPLFDVQRTQKKLRTLSINPGGTCMNQVVNCSDMYSFILKGAVALKLAQDEHKNNEQDLRKNKRSLKVRGSKTLSLISD